MRKLMWFAIGFGISCTLGAYFWVSGWVIPALLLGSAGLVLLFRKEKWKRRLAFVCLGLLLGTGWFLAFDRMYTAPLRALDGKTVELDLTTMDFSWETEYGTAVDCQLYLEDHRYKIRLYLNEKMQLEPWMAIHCPVQIRLTTDGGGKEPTFHRTQGILALGYQRDSADIILRDDREEGKRMILLAKVRANILAKISELIPGEDGAFARALLLGDKTQISYEMNTDFKVSGISHIVAVSGLHMSILFGLLAFVTWKRRWLLAVFGIPSIVLFMMLAGFTPSVTRAGIMMILMILSLVFKREYDPPTALAFSVVSMLAVNPLVAASVGFQLSVGSVAGIFLFMGKISGWILEWIPQSEKKWLKALRSWFAVSISVTLSAQVITTPLVAYYFQTVSLVSVLTNLAVLWVISLIFYGVMLVCLAGAVCRPLGIILGRILALPIRYVRMTAKLLAKLPLAAVYTQSVYIVIWLIFVYGLILLLITGKEKKPVLSICAGTAGLALALLMSWAEPRLCDQSVTVLDVGQGQSVIVQHGDKTFVVDCGGDYDEGAADMAAQTLLSMGISRIDGLILTHYDRDHSGGVTGLLYRIRADKLYLPEGERAQAILEAVQAEPVWVTQRMQLQAEGLNITLFPAESAQSGNESSIAVLFQTKKCDTLLTGDMSTLYEKILIRENEIPDLEILIAGHHGSKYATSAELLAKTAPDVAVISVGENNRYGHPAKETMERLTMAGCVVYRTDQSGTIVLRR